MMKVSSGGQESDKRNIKIDYANSQDSYLVQSS